MSFLDDVVDMLMGPYINIRVKRRYGEGPGDPAEITFVAGGFNEAAVTIQDSTGELVYQGHTSGTVVVAPMETTWYVLTVAGPEVYEQKVIKVEVRGTSAGDTPAWSSFTRKPSA